MPAHHGVITIKKLTTWCAFSFVVTAVIAVVSPLLGELDFRAALTDFSWTGEHETADGLIFWQTRIPRVLAGLIAGAALACSGLAFQAVLRNPLADPYILGVSSGAAIGKALAVLALPASLAALPYATPLLCFLGGIFPVILLAKMAGSGPRFSPVSLLLAGLVINLILSAVMMLVQVFADPDNLLKITYWWLGGLDVAGYRGPMIALPLVAVGIVILMLRARAMNLLGVDALTAGHLGINVSREVRWLLATGTLLAAASVALAGPIGFAGLLVPHILRLAAGPDHRLLVPLGAISGAGFLVLCDLLGWRALEWSSAIGLQSQTSAEIPVGVITALIGGPVFLALLVRSQKNVLR